MGTTDLSPNQKPKISRSSFTFHYIIGRGGFGKVWKVTIKHTNNSYALKEMSKVKIIDRKSESSILSERHLLAQLHHPFIVNMFYSFQDRDNLYLLMDLLTGGDLRYHLCRHKKFTEDQSKFFISNLILALEYIHQNKIIHRDIKPENLVLDKNGYLRLTDFGVAKKYKKYNNEETSGTPGYMAPEVLCAQNHSFPVDYFAIGVLGYEFMLGTRPYLGKNRKEIKECVLRKQVQIKGHEIPIGFSYESADFVNKLLQRKVSNRLGRNGIEELKTHPWFNCFKWDEVFEKKISSPFIPGDGDHFDRKYCLGEDKIGENTLERYSEYKLKKEYYEIFKNYTYDNVSEEELRKFYGKDNVSTNLTSNNNFVGNESESDSKGNKIKNNNLGDKNNNNIGLIHNKSNNNFHNNNSNNVFNKNGNILLKRNNSVNDNMIFLNHNSNNNISSGENNIKNNIKKFDKFGKGILMKNLTIKIQNGKFMKMNNHNLTFKNYNKEISRNVFNSKKKLFVFHNNLSGLISPLISNRQSNLELSSEKNSINIEDKMGTLITNNRNKKFPFIEGTQNNLKKSSSSSMIFNKIKKKSDFDSYKKFFQKKDKKNIMKNTGYQSPQNSLLNIFSINKKFPIFNKISSASPSKGMKRSDSQLDFLRKNNNKLS